MDQLIDALRSIANRNGHDDENEWDSMQAAYDDGYSNANFACAAIARDALRNAGVSLEGGSAPADGSATPGAGANLVWEP